MPLLLIHPDLDGTATRTVPAFRATRPGRLVKASWAQEADAAGTTMNVKVRNATRGVDMTAALDIAALAALAGADIVVNTDGSADFTTGDLITIVLTASGGTTGPSESAIVLDVQYGMMNDSGVGG